MKITSVDIVSTADTVRHALLRCWCRLCLSLWHRFRPASTDASRRLRPGESPETGGEIDQSAGTSGTDDRPHQGPTWPSSLASWWSVSLTVFQPDWSTPLTKSSCPLLMYCCPILLITMCRPRNWSLLELLCLNRSNCHRYCQFYFRHIVDRLIHSLALFSHYWRIYLLESICQVCRRFWIVPCWNLFHNSHYF